ncbi:Ldh family oxidoreductase [Pararhizobium haloflavum]|uniref:Ldh family oxidoreductase n=1 Tax=Pararhizobium haloflavum TaxID=2037914 RepID=UPI0018E4722D|nr:Ldh family oxidoreductase [Pararhizobium haloflavum]
MSEVEMIRVDGAAIKAQCEAILVGWGMDAETATVTAEVLLDCDLRGIDTHGISLLALYAGWIRGDGFSLAAKPEIERDGPSYGLINAHGGLGFAVSVQAVEMAVKKARATGIAAVGVRNSHHFGAAGYYARLAGRAGLVGLVATSTKVVCLVPPGASKPVLGTNPLAYAVPRKDAEPIVFDMATSTAAGNKVRMHHLKSLPVPEGWVVDGQGQPVTDPHEAYKLVYEPGEGGLTPLGASPHLGSHKGYGLALLVHFLGGALTGGTFAGSVNGREGKPEGDNIGHFFIAIDPEVFRGVDAFLADVEDVSETLKSTPSVDPNRPVMLPGDLEERVRGERLKDGVPLAPALVKQLSAIADELGVPFQLIDKNAAVN